jgi:hypothetical protein
MELFNFIEIDTTINSCGYPIENTNISEYSHVNVYNKNYTINRNVIDFNNKIFVMYSDWDINYHHCISDVLPLLILYNSNYFNYSIMIKKII